MVNEDEYSDIVRKRQEEDWVIDDGMETPLLAYEITRTKGIGGWVSFDTLDKWAIKISINTQLMSPSILFNSKSTTQLTVSVDSQLIFLAMPLSVDWYMWVSWPTDDWVAIEMLMEHW